MIKEYCLGTGFYEIVNFSFFSTKDIENFRIPEDDERAITCPS